jgi:acyl-coenzyme A synthetase/AMP-(fatty) acid ligase
VRVSPQGYAEVYAGFRWRIPEHSNIAEAMWDRHVGSNRTALIYETDSTVARMTFGYLQEHSRRLANALSALGLGSGDRIGILFPPSDTSVRDEEGYF